MTLSFLTNISKRYELLVSAFFNGHLSNLLPLIGILLYYVHSSSGADIQVNEFLAYDCSHPYDVKDVGFAVATNCISNTKVTGSANITYQVLHKERYRIAKGYRCAMERSQFVQYCGVYDHQTAFAPKTYIGLPMTVTGDICRNMWTTLTYTDPAGYPHPVTKNGITLIQYDEKGTSYVENGEVKCIGEDFTLPETHGIIH